MTRPRVMNLTLEDYELRRKKHTEACKQYWINNPEKYEIFIKVTYKKYYQDNKERISKHRKERYQKKKLEAMNQQASIEN
jgi:hypothetical protein